MFWEEAGTTAPAAVLCVGADCIPAAVGLAPVVGVTAAGFAAGATGAAVLATGVTCLATGLAAAAAGFAGAALTGTFLRGTACAAAGETVTRTIELIPRAKIAAMLRGLNRFMDLLLLERSSLSS